MIVFTHTGTSALQLVKQHEPITWIARLIPYINTLNTLRKIKNIDFYGATMLYINSASDQANIIYALASYKHIMGKIKSYNNVCHTIAHYNKQGIALSSAKGYTPKAMADLQNHYQNKIAQFTYKKRQMLLYDEVISCIGEKAEITRINN